jgi:hypothetical protein
VSVAYCSFFGGFAPANFMHLMLPACKMAGSLPLVLPQHLSASLTIYWTATRLFLFLFVQIAIHYGNP